MFSKVSSKVMVAVVAVLISVSAFAEGVAIPAAGVNVSAYVTAAIAVLGTIVGVCVGAYIAFRLIKLGMNRLDMLDPFDSDRFRRQREKMLDDQAEVAERIDREMREGGTGFGGESYKR